MAFTINNGADSPLESIYATDYWIVNKWFGDRLWGWGYNNQFGKLGTNNTVNYSTPIQTITGGNNWRIVGCTGQTSYAVKTDGTLWCWGNGDHGRLGDGSATTKSSPVQTITGGTNWKYVAMGPISSSVAAIKTDGTLWTWGYNGSGQLGDNSYSSRSSPVQTVASGTNWVRAALGANHTAAIKSDGTLWLWGQGFVGQLGNNNTSNQISPVQTTSSGTYWKHVACGYQHTAAVKTDGTLWCWGLNTSGQLGDNTITNKSSPVQTVAGGTIWKQAACGYSFTAAVKLDGTLWLWGSNGSGQLGDNTTAQKSSPVQTVTGGTNWSQVVSGSTHTIAIKTDGTLWGWGSNNYGQLGDNTVTGGSYPRQTYTGGTNWKQASAGTNHTMAISINNINTTGT
jgi:alpha-tubulin suppressor-like RCC1 family protein